MKANSSFFDSDLEHYCEHYTSGESNLLVELAHETAKVTRYPHNMSGKLVGQVLKLLVKITQSQCLLEIGTFTGYAALSMLEGTTASGRLFCCEVNKESAAIAQQFFEKSGHASQVTWFIGKAEHHLDKIDAPLDFVFIDADKKSYGKYLDLVLPKLKKNGLIVIDDALWRGKVLASPGDQDARTRIIHQINQIICKRPDVENVLLPIRHGLNIIRKL